MIRRSYDHSNSYPLKKRTKPKVFYVQCKEGYRADTGNCWTIPSNSVYYSLIEVIEHEDDATPDYIAQF